MTELLRRFAKPLDSAHLAQVLTGTPWPEEKLLTTVDAVTVRAAVRGVDPGLRGTVLEKALIEPLHKSLAGLSVRDAADMSTWHYLTVREFPEIVWRRWNKGVVPDGDEVAATLTPALSGRFLGSSNLGGVSRNTLARLWWTAHELHEGDDYDIPRSALDNTETFQIVFERFFGIYPDAARACFSRFAGVPEEKRRVAAKWLQQCLSTTVLETLSAEAVCDILDQSLDAHGP